MNELEPGIYEFVFTNFYGGVLMRYRIGDLLEVISLEDDETGIRLPQFRFYSRADDLIDLGSMARFTETSIWKALDDSGVKYEDWTARKERVDGQVLLHLYVELKDKETRYFEQIESVVVEQMKQLHTDFADLEEIFGNGQFKISLLPKGAFNRYIEAQRAAGADLAHIKPPHMQPKDHIMKRLLQEG
jgi:phenylacetate-coenzyme A ligase PaaK-like adenylate-forming protein